MADGILKLSRDVVWSRDSTVVCQVDKAWCPSIRYQGSCATPNAGTSYHQNLVVLVTVNRTGVPLTL